MTPSDSFVLPTHITRLLTNVFFFPALTHFYDADPEQKEKEEEEREWYSLDTFNMRRKYFLFIN